MRRSLLFSRDVDAVVRLQTIKDAGLPERKRLLPVRVGPVRAVMDHCENRGVAGRTVGQADSNDERLFEQRLSDEHMMLQM